KGDGSPLHVPNGEHDALAEEIVVTGAFLPLGNQPDFLQQIHRDMIAARALEQPIARRLCEANAEAADRIAREAALAQVDAGGLGRGALQQAALELLLRPADYIKHKGAALVLRVRALFF